MAATVIAKRNTKTTPKKKKSLQNSGTAFNILVKIRNLSKHSYAFKKKKWRLPKVDILQLGSL